MVMIFNDIKSMEISKVLELVKVPDVKIKSVHEYQDEMNKKNGGAEDPDRKKKEENQDTIEVRMPYNPGMDKSSP